ncbi:hypothetical protein GPALN_005237 [Globodera pallida]|nr:hypothetical protein GPALN_005237 [Globodera pallida]
MFLILLFSIVFHSLGIFAAVAKRIIPFVPIDAIGPKVNDSPPPPLPDLTAAKSIPQPTQFPSTPLLDACQITIFLLIGAIFLVAFVAFAVGFWFRGPYRVEKITDQN